VEQQGQFFADGASVKAGRVGLNLRMSRICFQRSWDDTQAEYSNVPNPGMRYPRPQFRTPAHQFQQTFRGGRIEARDGNARLALVVAELEIRTGDARAGRLPGFPSWYVTKKAFFIAN
jgi:hypothetical protein